jgi:hypothetical protein
VENSFGRRAEAGSELTGESESRQGGDCAAVAHQAFAEFRRAVSNGTWWDISGRFGTLVQQHTTRNRLPKLCSFAKLLDFGREMGVFLRFLLRGVEMSHFMSQVVAQVQRANRSRGIARMRDLKT